MLYPIEKELNSIGANFVLIDRIAVAENEYDDFATHESSKVKIFSNSSLKPEIKYIADRVFEKINENRK